MDSSGPPGDTYDDVMTHARAALAALNRAATALAESAQPLGNGATKNLDDVVAQLRADLADPT
jgi:hypothetical protein